MATSKTAKKAQPAAKAAEPAAKAAQPKPAAPRRYGVRLFSLFVLLPSVVMLTPAYLQPPPGVESWLMFDGVCNLCDGFVNFVADGDSQRRVRFGAQQKHMDLLARIGAPTDLSTLVLIQGDKFYTLSSAAMRTVAVMDWPWRAIAALAIIPTPLRDVGYKIVAKYRYLVFGKKDECRVPTGDFKKRFIDYVPDEESDPIAAAGLSQMEGVTPVATLF